MNRFFNVFSCISENVTCKDGTLQCGSGECIPLSKQCDFADDCFDGSDELNCGTLFNWAAIFDLRVLNTCKNLNLHVTEYYTFNATQTNITSATRGQLQMSLNANKKWDVPIMSVFFTLKPLAFQVFKHPAGVTLRSTCVTGKTWQMMILTGRDTREAQQALTLDPLTITLRATEGLVSDGYRMTGSNGETEDNRKAYKRGMMGGGCSYVPLPFPSNLREYVLRWNHVFSYSFFGRYL